MSQDEGDQRYGPVGAPQEDLETQETYDDATHAPATPGPATPQVERLPGEREEKQDLR